jgi:hypothetical protein
MLLFTVVIKKSCRDHSEDQLFSQLKYDRSRPITPRFEKALCPGGNLINALLAELLPDRMEAPFTNVLKKDYAAFTRSLPVFPTGY